MQKCLLWIQQGSYYLRCVWPITKYVQPSYTLRALLSPHLHFHLYIYFTGYVIYEHSSCVNVLDLASVPSAHCLFASLLWTLQWLHERCEVITMFVKLSLCPPPPRVVRDSLASQTSVCIRCTCLFPLKDVLFHSLWYGAPHFTPNSTLAPLTVPTVSAEQAPLWNDNTSPPADQPQAPPSNQMHRPTLSELPFGQQDEHPTLFGLLTLGPAPQSNPLNDQPPATDPELGMYWACMSAMLQTGQCLKYRCPMSIFYTVYVTRYCTYTYQCTDAGVVQEWLWVYIWTQNIVTCTVVIISLLHYLRVTVPIVPLMQRWLLWRRCAVITALPSLWVWGSGEENSPKIHIINMKQG